MFKKKLFCEMEMIFRECERKEGKFPSELLIFSSYSHQKKEEIEDG
jgi:hypothetical protein